jgi:hypothetical protein
MRRRAWAVALLMTAASGVRADEAAAVQAVEKLGGGIARDYKAPGQPVIGVTLKGPQITDAVLKDLADLKDLRSLNLLQTQVTAEGMKELKRFKQLRRINFCGTRVTDAGLRELKECCRLEAVYLYGSRVTDAGLDDLSQARPDLRINH